MASKMHPSKKAVPPIACATVGELKFYSIAEGVYDCDPAFLFQEADHDLLDEHLVDGRLEGVRFGCCLVRLPDGTNVLLDGGPFGPDGAGGAPGLYNHPAPEAPPHPLPDSLKALGVGLDDIHFVIYVRMRRTRTLTHVAAARALFRPTDSRNATTLR
jgi:hypothetical protein